MNSNLVRMILLSAVSIGVFLTYINMSYVEHPAKNNTRILVVVISDLRNQQRRQGIRKTWGKNILLNESSKIIFFMGKYKMGRPLYVEEESRKFGDIVFGDFYEDYYNLSVKSMEALKWALAEFKHFDYFVKVDDDTLLNVANLRTKIYLNENKFSKNNNSVIFCYLLKKQSPLRKNSKWRISYEEYPDSWYPPYCSGTCYVLSRNAVDDVVGSCGDKTLIHLEDVAITGVCGDMARVDKYNVGGFIIQQYKGDLCYTKSAVSHHLSDSPEELEQIYHRLTEYC